MFLSSILISLFACQTPATPYVPGVIKTDGTIIATVNGVQINDGIINSLLNDVPAEQRAQIMASPQFAQMQDQLITTEILYQEAIKAGIQNDPNAQLMMHLQERDVLSNFLIKKLAEAKATDEVLQQWYKDHMVQFRKNTADIYVISFTTEEEAKTAKARLDAGEDFATVAGELSSDPQAKATGGNMGNMDLTQLPPQLSMPLGKVTDGQVTDPVQMPPQMGGGYMLLKTENRKDDVTAFDEVKEDIKEDVMQEQAQLIVKELREKATVEYPAKATAPEMPAVPSEKPSTEAPKAE